MIGASCIASVSRPVFSSLSSLRPTILGYVCCHRLVVFERSMSGSSGNRKQSYRHFWNTKSPHHIQITHNPSPSPTCHALSRQILVLRLRDFKSEIMSAAAQTSASQVLSGPSQMNSPAFLSLANETPEKLAEVTRLMQILEVDLERKNLLPPSMYKYFRLEEESL